MFFLNHSSHVVNRTCLKSKSIILAFILVHNVNLIKTKTARQETFYVVQAIVFVVTTRWQMSGAGFHAFLVAPHTFVIIVIWRFESAHTDTRAEFVLCVGPNKATKFVQSTENWLIR